MSASHARSSQRGFTISEFLVAAAIFLFVITIAYTAFDSGRESYRVGEDNAEMQQRTRLSFELMLEEMRLAGFDYNRDGFETVYPDHPDEQLEWIGESALVFRANLDYTNDESGREANLEVGPSESDFGEVCCPIVTTGNDEIVAYALRSDDPSKNVDRIEYKVDTSAPRDAGWDPLDGDVIDEEVVEITNVDFSGDNPPYSLIRFHLDDNGDVVSRVMAADVRSLSFSYFDDEGNDYYCLSKEDDGTCTTANQMAFNLMGGADHVSGVDNVRRDGRADVRRIYVEIVGMTEQDDFRYVDEGDTLMPHRRKMVLDTVITPQNLGLRGRPDINSEDAAVPTGVTLCGGQCNTVRVEWNLVQAADTYQVNLKVAGLSEPFFSAVTPGIAVPGTDPARVYAVYQDIDHGAIVEGVTLVATVQSRTGENRISDESAHSLTLQLEDVTRLEAPMDVRATGYDTSLTGWPAVDDYAQAPLTEGDGDDVAHANEIMVSWVAPSYALDVLDQSDPANSWTTRADGAAAAIGCDSEMADADGDGDFDRPRTRSRELRGTARYLIFRSADPQFIPTFETFIGEAAGETAVVDGRVWFKDKTLHRYSAGIFQNTEHAVRNCETQYYRIRAVDACWAGGDPASTTDPHMSPFAPPLNPDPTADDSDDVSALSASQVGHAVPGFSVPAAKPRRLSNITFTDLDSNVADGDGFDALISFDAVKQDAFSVLDPLGNPVPRPNDIVVRGYKVFSHPSDPNFTRNDALAGSNGVVLDKIIEVWDDHANRIAHDDEDGSGSVSPSEDESVVDPADTRFPVSGLRIDLDDDSPRFYKVMPYWCDDEETIPSASNPDAFDYGNLSDAVQFPCEFGGGPSSMVYADWSDYDNSVTAVGYPEVIEVALLRAWIILLDPDTGERARSQTPVSVDAGGNAFFDAAHIAALTNNFGAGHYFATVEMEDENGCFQQSNPHEVDLGEGVCCLEYDGIVPHVQVGTLEVRHDVNELCGSLRMQILTLTLDIQKNSGQPRRYQNVWWSTDGSTPELIWSGSKLNVVIDRSADPLVIEPGGSAELLFDFGRDPAGSDLFITYDYRIAGQPGTCSFETLGL